MSIADLPNVVIIIGAVCAFLLYAVCVTAMQWWWGRRKSPFRPLDDTWRPR